MEQTLEQMNLENKGYHRCTDKNNSSKSRNPTWHTRLSFPKYRGNFEPPTREQCGGTKTEGCVAAFRKAEGGERCFSPGTRLKTPRESFPIYRRSRYRQIPNEPSPRSEARMRRIEAENIRPSFSSLRPALRRPTPPPPPPPLGSSGGQETI